MESMELYEQGVVPSVIQAEPEEIVAMAKRCAVALKAVLDAKPRKVMINDEQYLEFEDWQLLGKFYGITAKVIRTNPVSFGQAQGFEAYAVAVHRGEEVSAGEAMCLDDEERWTARPKYEWQYVLKDGSLSAEDPGTDQMVWVPNPSKPGKNMPKRQKIQIGEEAVPLFQLRSMAQTRACAKALRNCLAWVVVQAGGAYRTTPAEEMTGNEQTQGPARPQKKEPAPAKEPAGNDDPQGSGNITAVQIAAIKALCKSLKAPYEEVSTVAEQEGIIGEDPVAIEEFTYLQAGELIKVLGERMKAAKA